MNFDRIAPFYQAMETWLAGKCLHQCRVAFLDGAAAPSRALLVGEGHGNFLRPFRRRFPEAEIVVIDGSGVMLELSKKRAEGMAGVTFVHSMIEDWRTDERFDLIVTHFMLDCLTEDGVAMVVERLGKMAAAGAEWWVADFDIPERGWARWRARGIVRILYLFFGIVAGIRSTRLVKADDFLERSGFRRIETRGFEWGLLKADRWAKGDAENRID